MASSLPPRAAAPAPSAQAGPSQPRSRSRSPARAVSPTKDGRARKEGFDLRAEEDFARRQNIGRANYVNTGPGQSRGKRTDLFGPVIRQRLSEAARDHAVTIEADVLALLTVAAEQRIRLLLSSAISASIHRSSSSHLRPPPLHPSSDPHTAAAKEKHREKGSGQGKGKRKAMWKHRITSSPATVIEALNRQAKAQEQEFRANRMDRLARETEEQRARDAADRRERMERGESTPGPLGSGSGAGAASGPGAGLGAGDGDRTGEDSDADGASARKKQTPAKNLSAEIQHKITNATAMRGIGIFGRKQYSWLNTPSVSSPLAGRKRKKGKGAAADGADGAGGEGADAEGEVEADGELKSAVEAGPSGTATDGEGGMDVDPAGPGADRLSKKPRPSAHASPNGAAAPDLGPDAGPETPLPKKGPKRRPLSAASASAAELFPPPQRRQVLITRSTGPAPPAPAIGQAPTPAAAQAQGQGQPEKRIPDDRAVTVDDLLFALEKEGGRMGAGEGEAGGGRGVVWRARARGWEE